MTGTGDMRLPPRGSRGAEVPKPLRPLLRAMSWSGDVMFRLGIKVQGRPLVRLTTMGARTGKPRTTVVGTFPVEGRSDVWVIVASNAGSARHPGWAFNLVAHPDEVTLDTGDGPIPVDVELLSGAERESMWERVVELSPGYGRYTEKTDREIPLFSLSARA